MLKLRPFILVGAVILGGCSGYHPLYATRGDGSSAATSLAAVGVQEQHTRVGQLIRNELLDGTHKGGQRYLVNLVVTEKVVVVSALSATLGTRSREMLTAHYDVIDNASSKTLTSGDSFSNVEFNTTNIPVSDLQAATNAQERAARELGQDIRLRLATWLSQNQG